MTSKSLERIKGLYPLGKLVVCEEMQDSQAVPKGTKGIIKDVDDRGTIHVAWSNGSSLGLIPGVDSFRVYQNEELLELLCECERFKLLKTEDPSIATPTKGMLIDTIDQNQISVLLDNGEEHILKLSENTILPIEKEQTIRCIVVEPKQKPKVEFIENTLEAKQKIVGGYIEVINLDETAVLICNDEGKLIGLEPNRRIYNDIIAGTFLIVGSEVNNPNFISLSEANCEKYSRIFDRIKEISMEECQDKIGITFISW